MKKSFVSTCLPLLMLLAFFMLSPVLAFSQGPGGPGDGPPTGDAVPFDDNMNLLFLAVGIVFAGVVVVKQLQLRKKANA